MLNPVCRNQQIIFTTTCPEHRHVSEMWWTFCSVYALTDARCDLEHSPHNAPLFTAT